MPQIVIWVVGATAIDFDFDLPPVLSIPQQDNIYGAPYSGPGVIFAPDVKVYQTLQFKSGNPITLTAKPDGEFLRWEGACSGQGETCTLTVGGQSGVQDQVAMLVTGYQACEFGGPTVYSGFLPGSEIDPQCAIILP